MSASKIESFPNVSDVTVLPETNDLNQTQEKVEVVTTTAKTAKDFNQDALEAKNNDSQTRFQAQQLRQQYDDQKPKQVLVTETEARRINKGLDGTDRQRTFTTQELTVFGKSSDPREAIYQTALEATTGSSLPSQKQAVTDYINDLKNGNGGEAKIFWRSGAKKGQEIGLTELKNAITNQSRYENYQQQAQANKLKGLPPPKQPKYINDEKTKKPEFFDSMTIDSGTRQAVFGKWLDKNGTPEMKAKFERDKLESNINLRIDEAKKRLREEFDKLKNDNNLYNSFVEQKYQIALKDEIDKIVEQTKADFRGEGLGKDIGDVSESVMRGIVDNHPVYRFLPDGMRNEIVKFGVGVEKGTISLLSGAAGAGAFVNDAIQDTVVAGFKTAGFDTSKIESNLTEQRNVRKDFFQQLSSVSTAQMSREDRAYAAKIERGLYVTPYDLPNKAVTLGQAVPSIAIGVATGGGSLATQIIVSSALQATLAGGETYVTTNDRWKTTQAGFIAGVQGAIAPVTAKMPWAGDIAANSLVTYSAGKLAGKSDNEIFQDIVQQTALSSGFRTAKIIKELHANKEIFLNTLENALGESNVKNLRSLITEQGTPLKPEEGGAIYRTTGKEAGEMKYMYTIKTKQGVQLREISPEFYAKLKGNVKEVEISNRQFEAARGVRLTADGKIGTTDETKLAKNLDTVQGVVKREPRFVTPTTAEFFRKAEIVKGMREIEQIRQEFGLTSNRARRQNIGFAEISIDGQNSKSIAHSGETSKKDTVSAPNKRLFKTSTTREGNARQFDTELKILEDFASKHINNSKNIKGEIRLFTELPPCSSCTDVFRQFRVMFPNVKLEIISGEFRPAKVEGK